MTLYRNNKDLQSARLLEFPDNPERYCLYFIDDDESEHAPDYDMGPRSMDEPIGEFPSLAFILNKNFKQSSQQQGEDATMNQGYIQSEEERIKLEAEDKRLLFIQCNTVLTKNITHTVVMENSKQVGEVINNLSKKVKGKIQPNPNKYVIMASQNQPGPIDNDNEFLSDMFGGYNAFGQDLRVIDSKTIVRNLKTNKLELREKIFVDKPVRK